LHWVSGTLETKTIRNKTYYLITVADQPCACTACRGVTVQPCSYAVWRSVRTEWVCRTQQQSTANRETDKVLYDKVSAMIDAAKLTTAVIKSELRKRQEKLREKGITMQGNKKELAEKLMVLLMEEEVARASVTAEEVEVEAVQHIQPPAQAETKEDSEQIESDEDADDEENEGEEAENDESRCLPVAIFTQLNIDDEEESDSDEDD
jgi:hypothetical protein